MRFAKLQVENFKKLVSVDLDISDVNILVGANGCGKSSIIQAVHLACCLMRQAYEVKSSKTSTVGVDELDYLPTDDYKTLGHGSNWGNKEGTPSTRVKLTFAKPDGQTVEAKCTLRSARNAGISISGSVPPEATSLLRVKKKFFTAYIPGISGVPNREDRRSKKFIMKACSFGDSNFVLRNVLLLLKERNLTNITLIERWIGQIIGPITIGVSHNADDDLYIRCQVTIDGMSKPIELVGTGYLQLIQIFCYVLLFEPGVLLIDEPDIHLHPHVQERLVEVLTQVARERDIKILLTTHSPFIVRGAPPGTNVTWLKDGNVESHNRQLVEMALGWGAFGKSIILVSEDSRNQLLKKLIAQWPELDRSVAFYPGAGYKNLPTPVQVKELIETLGGKFKVLIHRDRDSLTDDEVATLQGSYEAEGGKLWCTEQSDIEAYFCTPSYLKALLGCTESEAIGYVEKVLEKEAVTIQQQFQKQRAAHNEELHAAGGSLPNDQVWILMQSRPLKGAKGKTVFKSLKNVIPANAFSENSVQLSTLSGDLAIDLKNKLEQVIAAA